MSNIPNNTAFWLDDQSITTKDLVNVLRKSSQLTVLIKELILDQALAEVTLEEDRESLLIQEFRETNKLESEESYSHFLATKNLNNNLLLQILSRPDKVVYYRQDRWGPRVNSLYLKHKSSYDLITYKRLESNNSAVMQEVYFRLKDKEDTWENLAKQFPGAPPGARIEKIPIAKLEPILMEALHKSGPGCIIKPLRIGDQMTIIAELESIQSSKLDESLRNTIMRHEFETWLEEESVKMQTKLRFPL